jgi:hypothetical protein
MKVLLKDTTGKGFLDAEGHWVRTETEAQDFKTTLSAMAKCKDLPAATTVVLVKLENPEHEFELTVCGD